VPDTWTYKELSEGGSTDDAVIMAPAEYGNLLLESERAALEQKMRESGAVSGFGQTGFPLKNSPLETYVKYQTDSFRDSWNVTSLDNGTISGQKAVKVSYNGINDLANQKRVEYLILNGEDAYSLYYVANVKDFDKYLPEFEQMVKSFKFKN